MTTTLKLARQMRAFNRIKYRAAPSPRKRAGETDEEFAARKAAMLAEHAAYRARVEAHSTSLAQAIHNAPDHKRAAATALL